MTPSISEQVASAAPLEIAEVEFQDPILVLSGEGWALTAMCPWRVLRGHALELSWATPDGEDRAWDLIGRRLVAAEPRGRDAAFTLSDGSVIEVFSDTDTDAWVLRLPGLTFVGPLVAE
jgi:diadenosine tetraphosphatase ApaH/serine/threonine PP2A family protein phosphatase